MYDVFRADYGFFSVIFFSITFNVVLAILMCVFFKKLKCEVHFICTLIIFAFTKMYIFVKFYGKLSIKYIEQLKFLVIDRSTENLAQMDT